MAGLTKGLYKTLKAIFAKRITPLHKKKFEATTVQQWEKNTGGYFICLCCRCHSLPKCASRSVNISYLVIFL